MVNITPSVRDTLEDRYTFFTHFYFMQEKKKWKTGFYFQQADKVLTLDPQLFCQQTEKK